jgi:hypothetical protein
VLSRNLLPIEIELEADLYKYTTINCLACKKSPNWLASF